jgi:hypothetical protein
MSCPRTTSAVAPVKRYINYTAIRTGGHVAVDTAGRVEINALGQNAVHETADVGSDALYPIVDAGVAANYDAGFASMPTLTDVVEAIKPIEQSYSGARLPRRVMDVQPGHVDVDARPISPVGRPATFGRAASIAPPRRAGCVRCRRRVLSVPGSILVGWIPSRR